jgi:hypothetical protein
MNDAAAGLLFKELPEYISQRYPAIGEMKAGDNTA